jgi:predicted dehydrogenase
LRNLKSLGVESLALVETDPLRRSESSKELGIVGFSDLRSGLDLGPDFVILATPTHLHMQQALEIVREGFDLFVEKPLSHSSDDLTELAEIVQQKRLVSMVACNMRFHPGPAKVKELLSENRLGKILFARIHAGSYLPEWRPGTDYRENYATREETGGGCILDCIHEIDLACWYLGKVHEVHCLAAHLSSLETTTEDVAAITCRHQSGAISEIHLDYVQRTYERGCQIVGEGGSVFWDFSAQQVRLYDAEKQDWSVYSQPEKWQINQMYIDEMKHFIECVGLRKQTMMPISQAIAVTQVALAAKQSARNGKLVCVQREVAA